VYTHQQLTDLKRHPPEFESLSPAKNIFKK